MQYKRIYSKSHGAAKAGICSRHSGSWQQACQPAWSRDHSFRQAKVDNMAASHPTQVCRGIVKQVRREK